jgi:hypothetical protein
LSWAELLGCVRARTVSFSDQAYGEHQPRPLLLRELFPKLAAAEPSAALLEDAPLPASQQFSRSPVGYLVFGPTMPPYQKTDPHGLYFTQRLCVVGALATLGVGMLALIVILSFFAAAEAAQAALGSAAIFGGIYLLLLLSFAGILLEWEWMFNHRKVRFMRSWLGDHGARRFYLWGHSLGLLILLGMLFVSASMAWQG